MVWAITLFPAAILTFILWVMWTQGATKWLSRPFGRVLLFFLAVTVWGPCLLWISYGFTEFFLIAMPDESGFKIRSDDESLRPILLGGFMLIAAVVVHAAGGAARDYLNRAYKNGDKKCR